MKLKHVITTLTLGAMAASGAVVGLTHVGQTQKADAAIADTIYLDLGTVAAYWNGKSQPFYAYFYDGSGAQEWASSSLMSNVTGNIYSVSTVANTAKVIFTVNRWNGDCQTADLTLPTDGKNLFTISSNEQSGSSQTGTWGTYVPPSLTTVYVKGNLSNLGGSLKAHYWGGTGATDWPGNAMTQIAEDMWSIQVPDNNTSIIFHGSAGQTADLDLTAGKDFVVGDTKDGSNHYLGEWVNHVAPAEFADGSAYLRGNWANGWTAAGQIAMSDNDPGVGEIKKKVLNQSFAADAEMKIVVYQDNIPAWHQADYVESDHPAGWPVSITADENKNAKVATAGSYDVYVNRYYEDMNEKWGYWFVARDYVAPCEPSATLRTYYVWDRGGVLGDTLANVNVYGFGQAGSIVDFDAYPGVHTKANVADVASHTVAGISHLYRVQLSESYPSMIINNGDGVGSKQTVNITNLGEHAGGVFYMNADAETEGDDTGKYSGAWYSLDDLSVANGTYLRGDWANGWAVSGQKTMNTNPEEGKSHEQMVTGLLLSADSKVKVVTYTDHVPTWHGATEVWVGAEQQGAEAIDGDGNAVLPSDGSYNLYVDTNNWKYYFVLSANDSLTKALAFVNTFHTALRADGVCDTVNGATTNVTNLASAWADLKAAYAAITDAGAKTLLQEGTANASLVAFAELYDMIIAKYSASLGASPDFLNRTGAPSAYTTPVENNNNALIIVVVCFSIATIVGASFLVFKAKKLSK